MYEGIVYLPCFFSEYILPFFRNVFRCVDAVHNFILDEMKQMAQIFCDGSCSPNPGYGGWGVIKVVDDQVSFEDSGWEEKTTNNRMELRAFIRALQLSESAGDIVYTDSRLAHDTLTKWMDGWKRNGWKKGNGKPPENLDLIQELDTVRKPHHNIEWVKAHCTVSHPLYRWNNYVDRVANDARERGVALVARIDGSLTS